MNGNDTHDNDKKHIRHDTKNNINNITNRNDNNTRSSNSSTDAGDVRFSVLRACSHLPGPPRDQVGNLSLGQSLLRTLERNGT